MTPLHFAVIGQYFGVVELLLLRKRAALDRRCRERRNEHHSLHYYAYESDTPDIVTLLLSAVLGHTYAEEEIKRPIHIHIAAAKGSVRIVEILLW